MKWSIVYSNYCKAVDRANAALCEYVSYSPECLSADTVNAEYYFSHHVIYVGKCSECPAPEGGYRIKAFKNGAETQMVILTGDGDINTLYAAIDFRDVFIAKLLYDGMFEPVYVNKPFEDSMPEYDETFVPAIENRAIWTWGYVIYDYRRFIDNMVSLKLNMIIIWNDYPPVNAEAIINYAHENGIKVVFGYSWGWNNKMDKIPHIDALSEQIISEYKNYYAVIGADGIYFQSFTEFTKETLGGEDIADNVTRLVNMTAGKLLGQYPDLMLQFGLHASSVKNKLDFIKKIDNRITIMWEDCGSVPYAKMPDNISEFEETKSFTERIMNLRQGGFGTVLKGMTNLNWHTFEHQAGPFVLGESTLRKINSRTEEQRTAWRFIQSFCIRNADYAYEIIKMYNKDTIVAALVEDGAFEKKSGIPLRYMLKWFGTIKLQSRKSSALRHLNPMWSLHRKNVLS